MVVCDPPNLISITSLTLSFLLLLTIVQTKSTVSQTTHHSKKSTSVNVSDLTVSSLPGNQSSPPHPFTPFTLPGAAETTTTTSTPSWMTANTSLPSWITTTTSTPSWTSTTTSSPTTSINGTTTSTTAIVSWSTTTPDFTPVVKLSVEDQNNQFGQSDFSFRLNTMKLLHECLCSPRNRLCELYPQNLVKVTNATTHVKLTNLYTCSYLVTKLSCSRASEMDAEASCIHSNTCLPDFTAFGPSCQLGLVNIEWNKTQKLTVGLWRNEVNSFLTCNASCSADSQGKGDDDSDEDDDDNDAVSPVVIGVVVAVGVVLFIIFITLIAIMFRSRRRRRKSLRSGERRASSEQTSTSSMAVSESIYASLDDNITADRTLNNVYLIPNIGSEKAAKNNVITGNHSKGEQDLTYAYIDPPSTSADTKNDYSMLDEAFQYRHVYKKTSNLPMDPRLRPPLPLPKKTTSEPLPYYSAANSFGASGSDADAVSGQYLELIGDEPQQPPSDSGCGGHAENDEQSDGVGMDTAASKGKAEIFELEKEG